MGKAKANGGKLSQSLLGIIFQNEKSRREENGKLKPPLPGIEPGSPA